MMTQTMPPIPAEASRIFKRYLDGEKELFGIVIYRLCGISQEQRVASGFSISALRGEFEQIKKDLKDPKNPVERRFYAGHLFVELGITILERDSAVAACMKSLLT